MSPPLGSESEMLYSVGVKGDANARGVQGGKEAFGGDEGGLEEVMGE